VALLVGRPAQVRGGALEVLAAGLRAAQALQCLAHAHGARGQGGQTTGRSSLSTTGRALLLLNVNDSNRMSPARTRFSMAFLPVLHNMLQASVYRHYCLRLKPDAHPPQFCHIELLCGEPKPALLSPPGLLYWLLHYFD
jgi:hypothetical protein